MSSSVFAPIIGVTLPEVLSRSLLLLDVLQCVHPVVNLRDDDCFSVQRDFVYERTYNNVTYMFSQANMTATTKREGDEICFMECDVYFERIGSELIRTYSDLIYRNDKIALFVYIYDGEFVSRNTTTLLPVKPAEVFPVIGYGAGKVEKMILYHLLMTAIHSRNLDEAYLTAENIVRLI